MILRFFSPRRNCRLERTHIWKYTISLLKHHLPIWSVFNNGYCLIPTLDVSSPYSTCCDSRWYAYTVYIWDINMNFRRRRIWHIVLTMDNLLYKSNIFYRLRQSHRKIATLPWWTTRGFQQKYDEYPPSFASINQDLCRHTPPILNELNPDSKVHLGQHGAHLDPVGPRWAPCWPHEPCYQESLKVPQVCPTANKRYVIGYKYPLTCAGITEKIHVD